MPFAGYRDFDDCVSKNRDKSDPSAYCGSIKAKTEKLLKERQVLKGLEAMMEGFRK